MSRISRTIVIWLEAQPEYPLGAWACVTLYPDTQTGEVVKYHPVEPRTGAGRKGEAFYRATLCAISLRGPEAL